MSPNLEKIVIFRSFQQIEDEIYDLSHFKQEHVTFFDSAIFFQLKDTARSVLVHEKATSFAELFSVEMKFTIDTLYNWFSNRITPKFLEVSNVKKKILLKKTKLLPESTCCICGFLLNINVPDEKMVKFCS